MESPAHGLAIYTLTKHFFGETVATVVQLLFSYDQASLRFLKSIRSDLKIDDLKRACLILVKYQLVDYVRKIKNFGQNYEYSVVPQRIFCFYRIPRYIQSLSKQEGRVARSAMMLIAEKGIISKSKLIEMLSKEYKGLDVKGNDADAKGVDVATTVDSLIHRRYFVEMIDNVCINLERFDRQYRDDIIVATLTNFYNNDPEIKGICRAVLDLSFENTSDDALITAPVPFTSLKNLLRPKVISDDDRLDTLLARLITERNFKFFISSGVHPQKGSMYAIDIGTVVNHLLKEHLCSVIAAKFGPKCCRVFRVLLQRGPLLLKQVEEFIMLPTKDVREYSYMLIKEGLVRNRQVARTLDNAPGKSVFIMSVELNHVVFKIADICCRSMSNILIRYDHEIKLKKSLLDRAEAVRQLTKESGAGEPTPEHFAEYFNSHELTQLESTNKNLKKLLLAKNQVDETLFLTHVWLRLRPNSIDSQ